MRPRGALLSLALAVLAAGAATAGADPYTYVNSRFGTTCTFPDEIFIRRLPEPDNGDGQQWMADDGASLVCSGIQNVMDETPKSFAASAAADQDSSYRITYSRIGSDWVVLSGFKDGHVFYQRRLFGHGGVIHTVSVAYPPSLKADYDALVGGIADSLRGP
ncbi:hypothetical protein [Arvimicrobium flavum]|uniref:hypothetical protein n=1 Tax=Arvimicrobium flavum TaxID=3393320 RepID=UPI00237B4F59|nr:hypothetical protein [Mesorhizobium shangrilense]